MIMEQVHTDLFTFDKMIEVLKGYKNLKEKVLQLEYELAESKPLVSDEEIIVSMAFEDSPLKEKLSKKNGTDDIALSYAQRTEGINLKHKQELEDEYCILKKEKERIEFYISILDSKPSRVLTLIYLNGKTLNETAYEMDISMTALRNARKTGIEKLVGMYNRLFEKNM